MLTCVVGLQCGDEGKGAIVDFIADHYGYIVRYNGGANAGHTIKTDQQTFKCHLLPSGIVKGINCVLAHGMVIDPRQLVKEIKDQTGRYDWETLVEAISVSDKAHCVMPWHIEKDIKNGGSIGTTARGIGPCYAEKMHRSHAIRMGDLKTALIEEKRFFTTERTLYGSTALYDSYIEAANFLQPFIKNTSSLLRQAVKNSSILFESANGMMLDIDFGTYPYVTSSGVGPAAIPQSCGLPNIKLDRIIGIVKSYMSRVGEGPFPTELKDNIGDKIREIGKEYGTTTGRPRRVGWLDLDIVKESIGNSGATEIALMHADVLFGFESVWYKAGGQMLELPGWKDIHDTAFNNYKNRIEDFLGIPIRYISFGPDRNQKIVNW